MEPAEQPKKFDSRKYKREWARRQRAENTAYAERQREASRIYLKDWKNKDPAAYARAEAKRKEWRESAAGKWSIFRRKAIRDGKGFDITQEQFLMMGQDHCHYCHQKTSYGVDRTDNNKGYVQGNVVPCCWPCNRAKKTQTYEDFVKWCV